MTAFFCASCLGLIVYYVDFCLVIGDGSAHVYMALRKGWMIGYTIGIMEFRVQRFGLLRSFILVVLSLGGDLY